MEDKPFVFDGQTEILTREVMEKMRLNEELLQDEPIRYLVYAWRGQIKVRAGKVLASFYPIDKTGRTVSYWLTKIPRSYMEVNSYGKVLCRSEEEIPQAVEMVRKYHESRKAAVIERDVVALSHINSIAGQQGYTILAERG